MLRSMTGYGRSAGDESGELLEVELRSVNNRGFKLVHKLPDVLLPILPRIEAAIRERVDRGTITLTIRWRRALEGAAYALDRAAIESYHAQLRDAQQRLGLPGEVSIDTLALLPGVFQPTVDPSSDQDVLWDRIAPVLARATSALVTSRAREGEATARALREHAATIRARAAEVRDRGPATVGEYREKLLARVAVLLEGSGVQISEPDVVREVTLFADRSDVSEELSRLECHLRALEADLEGSVPVGRKLEFLSQELLREANTMASKSHDTSLVQAILAIKLEVEKIREQVSNVE